MHWHVTIQNDTTISKCEAVRRSLEAKQHAENGQQPAACSLREMAIAKLGAMNQTKEDCSKCWRCRRQKPASVKGTRFCPDAGILWTRRGKRSRPRTRQKAGCSEVHGASSMHQYVKENVLGSNLQGGDTQDRTGAWRPTQWAAELVDGNAVRTMDMTGATEWETALLIVLIALLLLESLSTLLYSNRTRSPLLRAKVVNAFGEINTLASSKNFPHRPTQKFEAAGA
jgi:hypothetical protein